MPDGLMGRKNGGVPELPDLSQLSHAEKDDLIRRLWALVQSLTARVAALEARLGEPSKTPDISSLPPSKGPRLAGSSAGGAAGAS